MNDDRNITAAVIKHTAAIRERERKGTHSSQPEDGTARGELSLERER